MNHPFETVQWQLLQDNGRSDNCSLSNSLRINSPKLLAPGQLPSTNSFLDNYPLDKNATSLGQLLPIKSILENYWEVFWVKSFWVVSEIQKATKRTMERSIIEGQQKLLSTCVSIWAEAHKICKAWVFINQILRWCFWSYG